MTPEVSRGRMWPKWWMIVVWNPLTPYPSIAPRWGIWIATYTLGESWLDTGLPTYVISDCSSHSTLSLTNFVHKHGIPYLQWACLVILGLIECTWRNCSALTQLMSVAHRIRVLHRQNFLCDRHYHPNIRGVLLKALWRAYVYISSTSNDRRR